MHVREATDDLVATVCGKSHNIFEKIHACRVQNLVTSDVYKGRMPPDLTEHSSGSHELVGKEEANDDEPGGAWGTAASTAAATDGGDEAAARTRLRNIWHRWPIDLMTVRSKAKRRELAKPSADIAPRYLYVLTWLYSQSGRVLGRRCCSSSHMTSRNLSSSIKSSRI